jgi:hypothetical protein
MSTWLPNAAPRPGKLLALFAKPRGYVAQTNIAPGKPDAGVEVFGKSRRASGSPPECVKVVFLRHLLVVHELFGHSLYGD